MKKLLKYIVNKKKICDKELFLYYFNFKIKFNG